MTTRSMRVVRPWASRFIAALARGLDWRLLLLWTLLSLVPTTLVSVPIWKVLGAALDHSPRVPELAQNFDMLAFADLGVIVGRAGPALGGTALLATALALALWQLFTAMVLASANAEARLGFAGLFQGALAWYGRTLRSWLVSLVPLGLAGAVAQLLSNTAQRYAREAILESRALLAGRGALLASLLVLCCVHVTVEAARAELAHNPALRSGWRAWLGGVRQTLRRPLAVFGSYLGTTLASLLLASLLLAFRIRMPAGSTWAFWASLLLTQLAVASIGWGKLSRLFALTELARAQSAAARGELPITAEAAQERQLQVA